MNLQMLRLRLFLAVVVGVSLVVLLPAHSLATGVPIDGFLPQVGITLTSEFNPELLALTPEPSTQLGGSPLGYGSAHYDIAIVDTGAAISLLSTQADDAFNINGPYPQRSDGFRGYEPQPIGGAGGLITANINDPLGLYADGLQRHTTAGDGSFALTGGPISGQTNTSMATLPADSPLPNILGLPFIGQYATRIRTSAPQVFEVDGKTVRSPSIDFLPRGSGGNGINRKSQLYLEGDPTTAAYIFNIANLNIEKPWDNPSAPTFVQGGHFVDVRLKNNDDQLNTRFFLDTGASVTVVSEFKALDLGIDVFQDAPEFTAAALGAGGIVSEIPGFFVDELTIPALGGNVTVYNVPVIVLDLPNVAGVNNVVDGILGTNVFYGRDIVIDPNPALGGTGPSAGLWISDPVTTQFNWTSTANSAAWGTTTNWSANAQPGYLAVTNLRHVAGGDQEARITTHVTAYETNVAGGASGQMMKLSIASNASLTTFSGVNIEAGGHVVLESGTIDTQYVDIRAGGRLSGTGLVTTGSGQIDGQVENVAGTVAPGLGIGTLEIEGRYSAGTNSTLEFELAGTTPGSQHDQLIVDGTAALKGTLRVLLDVGYSPTIDSSFVIISSVDGVGGSFALLDLPTSYRWAIDYNEFDVTLAVVGLGGDYNNDGRVDAADYSVWRDSLGTANLAADGDNSGVVDSGDYTVWRNNFGNSIAGGSLSPITGQVPEPATLVLFAAGLVLISAAKRISRQC